MTPLESWRLLQTWDKAPGFNMGLDEWLLEEASEQVVLRFYTWKPDALSLGYFQRLADVEDTEKATALVRRITGGGAIHHTGELTFSITSPLSHPLYRGPVSESYERLHAVLIEALARFGVEASLAGSRGQLASDRAGTGMCFHASTPQDITWDQRKGVGSAQRRRAGRVLHHGSIKLSPSPLEGAVATLEDAGRSVTPEAFAATLEETMAQELGLRFEPFDLNSSIIEAAQQRGLRYTDPEFLRRR